MIHRKEDLEAILEEERTGKITLPQKTLYSTSDISAGKFRRLFNRHERAYRNFN